MHICILLSQVVFDPIVKGKKLRGIFNELYGALTYSTDGFFWELGANNSHFGLETIKLRNYGQSNTGCCNCREIL